MLQTSKQAHSIFSIDDINDFQEVFQYFDPSRKGYITGNQLRTTLRSLIPRPDEKEIRSLVEAFSNRKTERVTFKQYLDSLHDAIEGTRKRKIHDNKPKRKSVRLFNLFFVLFYSKTLMPAAKYLYFSLPYCLA